VPASAITFGNINDKKSLVAKLRGDERSYQVLADQNTRPRTTYVAAVINPNSELEASPWSTRRQRVEATMATSEVKTTDPASIQQRESSGS